MIDGLLTPLGPVSDGRIVDVHRNRTIGRHGTLLSLLSFRQQTLSLFRIAQIMTGSAVLVLLGLAIYSHQINHLRYELIWTLPSTPLSTTFCTGPSPVRFTHLGFTMSVSIIKLTNLRRPNTLTLMQNIGAATRRSLEVRQPRIFLLSVSEQHGLDLYYWLQRC